MSVIILEKYLPLKAQEGKSREYTITLRGIDLTLEDQVALLYKYGKPVKIEDENPSEGIAEDSPVARLITAITPIIAEHITAALDHGRPTLLGGGEHV